MTKVTPCADHSITNHPMTFDEFVASTQATLRRLEADLRQGVTRHRAVQVQTAMFRARQALEGNLTRLRAGLVEQEHA